MNRSDIEIDAYDETRQVRIIRWYKDGSVAERQDVDMADASRLAELDEEEIAWALETYGRCDTGEYCIWQPSENNGEEFPTHEAP